MIELSDDYNGYDLEKIESWTLFYPVRPWTVNKDRTMHPHARAKLVKEWRTAGAIDFLVIPPLEVMWLEVTPVLPDRRLQDTAACVVAEKAYCDGAVDARIVPDDKNQWLKWIRFHPCRVEKGNPGLEVVVKGIRRVFDGTDME